MINLNSFFSFAICTSSFTVILIMNVVSIIHYTFQGNLIHVSSTIHSFDTCTCTSNKVHVHVHVFIIYMYMYMYNYYTICTGPSQHILIINTLVVFHMCNIHVHVQYTCACTCTHIHVNTCIHSCVAYSQIHTYMYMQAFLFYTCTCTSLYL